MHQGLSHFSGIGQNQCFYESNKYAMTRNWNSQNPSSALKTKTGK